MAHNLLEAGLHKISPAVAEQAEPMVSAIIVASLIALMGTIAIRQLKRAPNALIPEEKLTLRTLFELFAGFVVHLGDTVMGKHNRKYIPFVGSVFIYVLFMNFFGLIPGLSMPTDSFTFNFGIAIVVFVLYTFWGIKEVGIVAYLKHLCGPGIQANSSNLLVVLLVGSFSFVLSSALFAIETVSHFIRPLTLGIRLFANMTADHLVLQSFTDLVHFGVPVIFYGLGTFVCFIQAFIFMLLTMVYIGLAVAHEEHHEEAH